MKITETKLAGCFLIEPKIIEDYRGVFFEVFRKKELEYKLGYEIEFVQENQSISRKGVLRGLHYQKANAAQAKLVSVTNGKVLDVVVDLRKKSETYGQHLKTILDGESKASLFIPKGMAHGFLTLADRTVFSYKCDNYYSKAHEDGILYNDTVLKIDWNYTMSEVIVSEKDLKLPKFDRIEE